MALSDVEANLALIDEFKLDLVDQGKADTTMVSYLSDVKRFAKLMGEKNITFMKLGLDDLILTLREIRATGVMQSRIENQFGSLSSMMEYLVFTRQRIDNPVPSFRRRYLKRYKGKNGSKLKRFSPSLEQVFRIIHGSLDTQERTIHILLGKTGIRRSTMLRLNVKDVNLVEKTIRLHDSHKLSTLVLPVDEQCIDAISNWLHERAFVKGSGQEDALFLNSRGGRLGRNSLGRMVNAAGMRVGIHNPDAPKSAIDQRFSPHCYRHFFTTMMRNSNCPERIITYMRGDAPKNIRDIYDHLEFDEVERQYNAHIWKLRW